MKKIKFFTLMKQKGHYIAEQKDGWTDGTYNYYRPNQNADWYCILPDYGLSVTRGRTPNEARQKADAIQDKIDQALKTDYAKDILNKFEKTKAAANHKQTNDGNQNNNN